jgi:hypothetical protein
MSECDRIDVKNYQLTEVQREKIFGLMNEFGYNNIEIFMDAILRYGYHTLEGMRKEK